MRSAPWFGIALVALGAGTVVYAAPPILHYAVCKQDIETVRLILESGIDPNAEKYGALKLTALDLALLNGNDEVISRLLRSGAKPTANSFYFPCKRSHLELICSQAGNASAHEGCRFVSSGADWRRRCTPPDPNCQQVLAD